MKRVPELLILFLVVVAATIGVSLGSVSESKQLVTVRGDVATYAMDGVYRFNPLSLAEEGRVWDGVTLIVGVPLFAFAIRGARRGNLRGTLLMLGLLGYFFYMYLQYAMMWAAGPLFPIHILIFSLSLVQFLRTLRELDLEVLRETMKGRFPVKLFVRFAVSMSTLLVLLWSKLIYTTQTEGFAPNLAGLVTLETQAMDLGFIVPLGIAAAVLLKRDSALGYLLMSITIVFGSIMCVTIPTWIVDGLIRSGSLNWMEAAPFAALCLFGLYLMYRFTRAFPQARRTTARRTHHLAT